jgi:Bacteriocin-protection, YdeI or OmpD-Associated/Domain of unknown function (DUF1905)
VPHFDGVLAAARQGGAYVEVPDDVVRALGGAKRIPVRASFDGVPYQGSVVSMGGCMVLGVLKTIRQQLGKEPGDVIAVRLELDDIPRRVVVPGDLAAALDEAGARAAFDALSPTHRREHVRAIEDAKRPETRAKRVAAAVAMAVSRSTGGGSSSPSSPGRRAAGPA